MENQNENIKSLIKEIRDRIGKPVSNRVVVATIESLGIRNKDTESDYGIPSVYELADLVYYELTQSEEHADAKNLKEQEAERTTRKYTLADYPLLKAKIFMVYYPKGILHLLPVLLQIAAIIVFGYSLWTYVGFNHVQSTAVVLGVIIGLVVTGGFVQVIGRQASFYWNHEDFVMVRNTINYLLRTGIKALLVVIALIFLANFTFHLYPMEVLFIVFTYAFLIGLLLLVLAPLHTMHQGWVISASMVIGTALAITLKMQTDLKIYLTHWIGIIVAIVIARLFQVFYFRRLVKKGNHSSNLEVKPEVLFYHNYKFFLYGFFVYLFIFMDRILAWSSTINGPLPYVVYFEKDYELGMDMAILIFLLLTGVLEFSIASFTRFLDIGQKIYSYESPEAFNKSMLKMYKQHVALLFATAAAVSVLIYFLIYASWGYKGQFHEDLLQLSVNVCIMGGAGYLFLAWGMLNTLYLFTLSRPTAPLKAIVAACIVNFIVGFIGSRFISYEYSVLGMLAGSLVFMLMTLRANLKFFNNLDYYYYAAY